MTPKRAGTAQEQDLLQRLKAVNRKIAEKSLADEVRSSVETRYRNQLERRIDLKIRREYEKRIEKVLQVERQKIRDGLERLHDERKAFEQKLEQERSTLRQELEKDLKKIARARNSKKTTQQNLEIALLKKDIEALESQKKSLQEQIDANARQGQQWQDEIDRLRHSLDKASGKSLLDLIEEKELSFDEIEHLKSQATHVGLDKEFVQSDITHALDIINKSEDVIVKRKAELAWLINQLDRYRQMFEKKKYLSGIDTGLKQKHLDETEELIRLKLEEEKLYEANAYVDEYMQNLENILDHEYERAKGIDPEKFSLDLMDPAIGATTAILKSSQQAQTDVKDAVEQTDDLQDEAPPVENTVQPRDVDEQTVATAEPEVLENTAVEPSVEEPPAQVAPDDTQEDTTDGPQTDEPPSEAQPTEETEKQNQDEEFIEPTIGSDEGTQDENPDGKI